MRNLLLGSLFLSLAGSIWGAMFIAVRLSIQVIAPVPLVWMRYGVALLSLLVLVTFLHESLSIARKDWKRVFFVALIGQTTSIVTQETGTMLTSAQAGSVLTASTPVFMVIFGVWLLHERLTAGRVAPSCWRLSGCSSSPSTRTALPSRPWGRFCSSLPPSPGPSCPCF